MSGHRAPLEIGNPASVTTGWLPAVGKRKPAEALDEALADIRERYGERTVDIVAMLLEYPRQGAP